MRWYRAQVRATIDTTEEMVHTFNFVREDNGAIPSGGAELPGLAAGLAAQWVTSFNAVLPTDQQALKAQISPRVTYTDVGVAVLSQDTPGGKVSTAERSAFALMATPQAGAQVNQQMLPHQVALAVTLQDAEYGARHRGRVYLGGFSVAAMGNNSTVGSNIARMSANFVKHFLTGAASGDLVPVIVSRAGLHHTPITRYSCGSRWDIMRSRGNDLPDTRIYV